MASNKLVEVYASFDTFTINDDSLPPEGKSLLFAHNRFKGSPGAYTGEPAIVGRTAFKRNFESFTHNFFEGVDWDNVLVAGGSILGCLRDLDSEIEQPSDIDVFLYNLSDEERPVRVRVLLAQLYASLHKSLTHRRRSRRSKRLEEGQEDFKEVERIMVIKTPNALTLVPSLVSPGSEAISFPSVQLITRKYPTKRSIFMSFDVDCCCVGFDGVKVWAHPRAQRALVTGVNTIDLAYKNPRSFEYRLLKYARRGFALFDPALSTKPTLLSTITRSANSGLADKVPVEWLVRCIRRTSGLLQIMLADEAEQRGVQWATGFESIISFDGEIDDELDSLEAKGEIVDADGNLLVFGPLADPFRHGTFDTTTCTMKDLMRSIAVPAEQESQYLRFSAGLVPARDANNRKAWEMGLYEEEEDNDLSEPLVSGTSGQASSSGHAKPSASSMTASSSSSGSPTSKRRNMGGRGARVGALLPPSLLMDLPRVLLLEILQRCAGSSLANLAATCKPLNHIISGGMWRRITERDFGNTSERPFGCRQPEPWNALYGALEGFGFMAWRQWDEHPLRLECVPDRRQGEHPFARRGHATSFMGGDKLVMTGGLCSPRTLEPGTFVFDLATSKWTKQATTIRSAPLFAAPIHTRPAVPYELSSRTHHTSTAFSENDLLLLFGKQRATEDAEEPSLVSEVLSLDVQTWTYTGVRQEGIPPSPRRSHSACLHPDENALLVFGGNTSNRVDLSSEQEPLDNSGDAQREFTPDELEVLDDLHVLTKAGEHVWAWSQPVTSGKAPMARCGHSACVVGRKMIVVGGNSNVLRLPNEVFILDVDTLRWSTLFMPSCFPPKNLTLPNTAVVVGSKLLLTRGGAETYVIDLEEKDCEKLHDDMFDKKLGRDCPEVRTGHTLTRVGVSVYMVGGSMDLSDEDRKPIENLQILDLIGKRVV